MLQRKILKRIYAPHKKSLCNPNGNVTVIVGSEVIEVNVLFKFEDGDELVNFKVLNDLPFSVSETNLALIWIDLENIF